MGGPAQLVAAAPVAVVARATLSRATVNPQAFALAGRPPVASVGVWGGMSRTGGKDGARHQHSHGLPVVDCATRRRHRHSHGLPSADRATLAFG